MPTLVSRKLLIKKQLPRPQREKVNMLGKQEDWVSTVTVYLELNLLREDRGGNLFLKSSAERSPGNLSPLLRKVSLKKKIPVCLQVFRLLISELLFLTGLSMMLTHPKCPLKSPVH